MSYFKKTEYEIVPTQSFTILRNCSGCGRKTCFKNTNRFRVNANGNKLDVWLIYQCEKCRHTFNITIYERQSPASIPKEEYRGFLENDEQLAMRYGTDTGLFTRNRAEIDFDHIDYRFKKLSETIKSDACEGREMITIQNPYGLKIRLEKLAADILGMSRNQIKKQMQEGKIKIFYFPCIFPDEIFIVTLDSKRAD